MNASARIFYILCAFFVVVAIAYGVVTGRNQPMGIEPVGFATLLGAGGLGGLIGIFLTLNTRAHKDRPEDRLDGEVSDQAGVQGSFAPYSWWPLWAAAGAALCFLGVAAGWWIFAGGLILAFVGIIGWVLEFSSGHHAH
ncbi:aa3-type cytochrome oxidase subunit IV [Brachybacterium sp. DNPG3]